MKILLLGATGMVGQGVLRECLLDPGVHQVVTLGRTPITQQDPKLTNLATQDLFDLNADTSLLPRLIGLDACYFCLGVSSAGMSEADYRRVTFDLTLSIATTLCSLNSGMVFIYVSGTGTDSSQKGRAMWARVKGATENVLLKLPFRAAYMFRPAMIVPLHGIRSKTPLYQLPYIVLKPVLPFLYKHFPTWVTTTEQLGRAMLNVTRTLPPRRIFENLDINQA